MGDWQTDWCRLGSDADIVLACFGEECANRDGEAVNLPMKLHSYPHLWPWALSSDRMNEIVDFSSGSKFPREGIWARPYRSSAIQSRAATPLHEKDPVEMV